MATLEDAVSHADESPASWPGSPPVAGQRSPSQSTDSIAETRTLERPPSLHIRSYTPADIPALARLAGTLRLDAPDSLVWHRSVASELAPALPVLRSNRPAFVATDDGQPVGYVRFSPRRPDGRWIVSVIAASTGVFSPEPVWEALLAHGARAAGLRGVRRLFARVPLEHPLLNAMRETGWTSYATETLLRADRAVMLSRATRELRRQEPADTWAIHQLYAAATPRQVQEIEALTSQIWHMEQPRRFRRGARQTGWLVEQGGRLAAYARYSRGLRASMIDLVVPPGNCAQLGALLDGVLAVPARHCERPIYCALRGYSLDLKEELTNRGFAAIGEQELLIRYTTATARTPVVDAIQFPVELRPALPRRVPTFLEGQATDGAI